MHHRTARLLGPLVVAAFAAFATSCTDPVNDRAIERLGGEIEGVPPGPEHRPGQPCVLCHSEGGPASKFKFAVGGTVFNTNTGADPAKDVKILFIDSEGVDRQTTSNAAGNFFIRDSEWPDLTYPFKTALQRGTATATMQSTVNREASCNFCHQLPGGDARESIGPIFAPGAPP